MKTVSFVLWGLTVALGVTGLIFLFLPNQLTLVFNIVSTEIGWFEPVPDYSDRLWIIFSFAYMLLVTALAGMSARHPGNSGSLLMLLIAGKVSTSFCGLAFFLLHKKVLLYLVTFFVDGGIALLVLWCLLNVKKMKTAA